MSPLTHPLLPPGQVAVPEPVPGREAAAEYRVKLVGARFPEPAEPRLAVGVEQFPFPGGELRVPPGLVARRNVSRL